MSTSPRSILMKHQLRREHAALLSRVEALETARNKDDLPEHVQNGPNERVAAATLLNLKPEFDTLQRQQTMLQMQFDAAHKASSLSERELRDRLDALEQNRSRQQDLTPAAHDEACQETMASYHEQFEKMTAAMERKRDNSQQLKQQLRTLNKRLDDLVKSERSKRSHQSKSSGCSHLPEHEFANNSAKAVPAKDGGKTDALSSEVHDGCTVTPDTRPTPLTATQAAKSHLSLPFRHSQSPSLPANTLLDSNTVLAQDARKPRSLMPLVELPSKAQSERVSGPEKLADKKRKQVASDPTDRDAQQDSRTESRARKKARLVNTVRGESLQQNATATVQPAQRTTRSRRNGPDTKLLSPIRNPETILKAARKGVRAEAKQAETPILQTNNPVERREKQAQQSNAVFPEYLNPWLAAYRARRAVEE